METFLEILMVSGLGLLGILIYAFKEVWKKIQRDGFNRKRFFNENIAFWVVCIVLNILFAIAITAVPQFKEVLHTIGFAIENDNLGGFILLGYALGGGSDQTKITGSKTLNTGK
jgi:uncharacterized BrkB/YihY/UPF0761 family membrane protein